MKWGAGFIFRTFVMLEFMIVPSDIIGMPNMEMSYMF